MTPIEIPVRTASQAYSVYVGEGLTAELGDLLDRSGATSRRFVISSAPIWRLHGARLAAALPGAETMLIPDGERSKTLATVARMYDHLIRAGADRSVTLVALGGGVVGDVV